MRYVHTDSMQSPGYMLQYVQSAAREARDDDARLRTLRDARVAPLPRGVALSALDVAFCGPLINDRNAEPKRGSIKADTP